MTRVIVLRPEPAAFKTIERAREMGLNAEAQPLFEVEPLAWEAPEPGSFDGLLLTSANAIRHGGEQLQKLRGLPVYAVGDATAEAAGHAGFDIASIGEAGVARLLASIESGLRLLHLCGAHRKSAEDMPQEITAIPVYRSRAIDVDLPDMSGAVALIHSPRAGRRLADLVRDRSDIAIAAISPAAAEAAGDGWVRVEAAETPSDDALLALAAQLCKTLPAT